jgi:hypothetical protein
MDRCDTAIAWSCLFEGEASFLRVAEGNEGVELRSSLTPSINVQNGR